MVSILILVGVCFGLKIVFVFEEVIWLKERAGREAGGFNTPPLARFVAPPSFPVISYVIESSLLPEGHASSLSFFLVFTLLFALASCPP